jgi:hypothetical protein
MTVSHGFGDIEELIPGRKYKQAWAIATTNPLRVLMIPKFEIDQILNQAVTPENLELLKHDVCKDEYFAKLLRFCKESTISKGNLLFN